MLIRFWIFMLTCFLIIGGVDAIRAAELPLAPSPILDRVGDRADKNSVGHGKNVALYTGMPSRFFFATHNLGDVFNAVDGQTLSWYPDQVIVSADPTPRPEIPQLRQVFVTEDDVVVSRIHLINGGSVPTAYTLEINGDCRKSFDWRNKPGGEKVTRREGGRVLLLDYNVFPEFLPGGLAIAVGASIPAAETDTSVPGAYRMVFHVDVPAGSMHIVTFACAIDADEKRALANLEQVLKEKEPAAKNRQSWEKFFTQDVPQFECSDPKLNEIYAFRWFLLKFSTAGGNLGLFKYPVVMEGRQAFQTYCCYSAPFMAMDLNWANDADYGFGHIANIVDVEYEDGRFPWYASPRTNRVPLDHPSRTCCSLLPAAAWKFYQIHGRKDLLAQIYDGMKRNVRWWIADRDPDGNGLFEIDHQLETGMDDLRRRWHGPRPARYEAVDATVYAYLNLRAVANMARELGHDDDARELNAYADKTAVALNTIAWDKSSATYRDRNPKTGELSDYNSICALYPLMTDIPQAAELLHRAVANHFTPRADFYERYDPITGKPLSTFRDYMHSWWIDVLIRHAAGLMPQDDGSLVIDPLPLGLEHFSLRNAPHRGRRIDVLFNDPAAGKGLVVNVDGKQIIHDPTFQPGNRPHSIPRPD